MNDVALNKKDRIERCVRQIRNYYALPSATPFAEDHLRRDAVGANLQRACELCIDLANHAIRLKKLGLPRDSRDSFRLLAENGMIGRRLSDQLQAMVGFRNVLVHEYRELDIALMVEVIETKLDDLLDYTTALVRALSTRSC